MIFLKDKADVFEHVIDPSPFRWYCSNKAQPSA